LKRVYIAGAYSADNVLGVLDNIRKGIRWGTKVLLAGHAPYVPWLDFQLFLMLRGEENLSVENFYNMSTKWLEVSDVMFMTPGWENSVGSKMEKTRAESLGIPIVYDIDRISLMNVGE
jgi:hypothetical protein